MINMTPVVCLFARAPVEGTVKKRLAREIGEDDAFWAYKKLVRHTAKRIRPVTSKGLFAELWIQGSPDYITCREWATQLNGRLRQQHGGDIGAAMWHTAYTHLKFGRHVIIVGSDVVSIDANYVRDAATQLEEVDVVIGPAEDGGYGLIGLSRPAPELFRGIPWGTSSVYARTMEKIEATGRSVVSLPVLWDVDTAADWERFKQTYPELPVKIDPRFPFRLTDPLPEDDEDPVEDVSS